MSDCEELVEIAHSDYRVGITSLSVKSIFIYSFGIPTLTRPSSETSLKIVKATTL